MYKTCFPRLEGSLISSEDLIISLFSYLPCCNNEDFHEELMLTLCFCFLDCIEDVLSQFGINLSILSITTLFLCHIEKIQAQEV